MTGDDRGEVVLDHYRNPRRRGRLADPTVSRRGANPYCGDEVTVDLAIRDGVVVDAAFEGRGCSISQATASMLMESVVGCVVEDLLGWNRQDMLALLGIGVNLYEDAGNGTPGTLIADNTVRVGDSFFVEITVEDLRDQPQGVNGLAIDLTWDAAALEVLTPFDPTDPSSPLAGLI